jgi:hypothetical protein
MRKSRGYPMHRRLGGTLWFMSLSRIKPRPLGRPARSLGTMPNTLSLLLLLEVQIRGVGLVMCQNPHWVDLDFISTPQHFFSVFRTNCTQYWRCVSTTRNVHDLRRLMYHSNCYSCKTTG